ncbi:GTPase activator [Malassezia pachydermatis]|uniref:Uncharacterized protein n=1 Tax=Malassezia pachydermatis TaxID=77020 RepID=A0A0M9VMY7_9BASI|nr:hypothetical protein Malapachy_1309 [Malassezia pachydermatis]KOS12789.1 hypothetical protein Malapachy_1309 [Malassezia pachydermatis]
MEASTPSKVAEATTSPSSLSPSKTRHPPTRGILRAPPPPGNDTLWKGRAWWYQVNARLAQQNIDVKIPAGTSHMLSGMMKRWNVAMSNDAWAAEIDIHTERLRRVHFRTEDLAHTYPISRTEAPESEASTRQRIEDEALARAHRLRARPWTARELQSLYRVCCRAREDVPHYAVLEALQQASSWPTSRARTLDFSDAALGPACIPLTDMLTAPTGTQVLVLAHCALDDTCVRAIVRALFASQAVHTLNIAANPGIQLEGWRAISTLLSHAPWLRHLDVSENTMTKAAVRALLAPLALHRATSLQTLRMESCQLRGAALDLFVQAVRVSTLRHLSLRRNQLGPTSGEALYILLCDMDEQGITAIEEVEPLCVTSVPAQDDPYGDEHRMDVVRSLTRDISSEERRTAANERASLRDVLLARTQAYQHALLDVTHVGHLWTLDLKSNALHDGVMWLATALRRNRTLRVLSLSHNELTPAGLACLADALRFNTTLETLDLSHNPCCGPDLSGIVRLRLALAIHPRLKRLVLSDTHLAAEGALALAECLPDAQHLVHLDVSQNSVGLVGLLALSAGTAPNTCLRCVDVTLSEDLWEREEYVRAARALYATCAQNTKDAELRATEKTPVQRPLDKSVLAATLQRWEGQARPATAHDDSSAAAASLASPPEEWDHDWDPPSTASDTTHEDLPTQKAHSLTTEEGVAFRVAKEKENKTLPADADDDALQKELQDAVNSELV